MGEKSEKVIETKLDILIGDFRMLKKNIIWFTTVAILPFAVYQTVTISENKTEIRVIQEALKKANGHRFYIKDDVIQAVKEN